MLRFATYFAALSGLILGYNVGVTGPTEQFFSADFGLDAFGTGLVVAALLLGAMVGAGFGGRVADRIGRRRLLIVTAWAASIAIVASAVAPDAWTFSIARIVTGAAAGMASVVAPVYNAEVSPPARRGAAVSLFQLLFAVGVMAAFVVGTLLASGGAWRVMIVVGAAFGVVQGIGLVWMPDSPRWLVWQDRSDAARDVLRSFDPANPDHVDALVDDLVTEHEDTEAQKRVPFADLLKRPIRMALIIGVGIALIQQFTGIGPLTMYLPRIFEDAGFGDPTVATGLGLAVQVTNFVATIFAIKYVDSLGRRPLLLAGMGGITVSLALIGLGDLLVGGAGDAWGWMTVVFTLTYRGFFAISVGPITYVLISEIFPQRARGKATSIATATIWGGELTTALAFPSMVAALGLAESIWVFAFIGVLGLAFVARLVPETKGRTLEAISADWR